MTSAVPRICQLEERRKGARKEEKEGREEGKEGRRESGKEGKREGEKEGGRKEGTSPFLFCWNYYKEAYLDRIMDK